jgi:NADH-quinone oxidoreductase subunit F
MYEVEMGTPLRVVIDELGGGFKEPVKAMHIGGPLGGLVPISKIDDLSIDFESFSQNGFLLGHASVVCIPESYPLVKYLEHLFEFTAHESCGKCFPCRLGSTRGKEMFKKAQTDAYKMDRELLDDLLDTLERGSLCALGGGLPLPIKNALHYFEDELKHYFN